ncbi:hypothetical protein ACOJBQ_003912 [Cronobacter muytjensii]
MASGNGPVDEKLSEVAGLFGRPMVLKVGFLSGATYPDGTPVPLVAAANEFGNPSNNQPPRPFFRNAIANHDNEWSEVAGKLAEGGPVDTETLLGLLGEKIKSDIQEEIRTLLEPPLSPATIKRKGFSKPLIDTSHMLNSVDYEISEGE